jgi:translation initiation factor IF-3
LAIYNRYDQNRYKNSIESKFRYNEQITSPTLRVISEDGEQLGVMDRQEAIDYAKSKFLDLIEVASMAKPPVARVQSWSKFKFEHEKREKLSKKKSKSKEIKEMWFAPMIGKNDLEHKLKRVREFLDEKHNVKLVIKMHGRINYDAGKQLMTSIIESLSDIALVDTEPKYEQRQILAIVRPGKS